jgi:formiminotetrahydrofolate cyclodeaminase
LLSEMKVIDLLKKTASSDPVPGGGSMSALAAAVAASLVEMVANLTIGRKGFEGVEEEMKTVCREASHYREKFTGSIDRDSAAYAKVLAAFRMPKDTETEKEVRTQAVQRAFRSAAEVPLSVAEDVLDFMPVAQAAVEKGNPNACTDGLVGVMLARTGALGALHNVKINLRSINDNAYVTTISRRVQEIENLVIQMEQQILKRAISQKSAISSS